MTFIHVTHAQDEALALSDRLVVMDGGRVLQSGTPAEVFNTPATRFVAEFMGGHNVAGVEVLGSEGGMSRFMLAGTRTVLSGPSDAGCLPVGRRCAVAVRTDAVEIAEPDVGIVGRNTLPARVLVVEYLGPLVRVDLQVPGFERFGVTMAERAFLARPVAPHSAVTVTWAPGDTHLMPDSGLAAATPSLVPEPSTRRVA